MDAFLRNPKECSSKMKNYKIYKKKEKNEKNVKNVKNDKKEYINHHISNLNQVYITSSLYHNTLSISV